MRDLIKAVKALSDETRLRILNLLLERECCVCEVMQALEITQTRASRNLSALHDGGFLKLRKEGPWVLYSIATDDGENYHSAMLEAVGQALKGDKLLARDRQQLRKAKRIGPGCGEPSRKQVDSLSR